jgi:NADPH:quinone reductase-like Zn-dependent oxidoreductase
VGSRRFSARLGVRSGSRVLVYGASGAFSSAGGLLNFAMVPLTARSRGRRVLFAAPAFSQPNVVFLAELMESGAYRPLIDRVYRLDQVVDANRYVETERKTGNVALTVA